MRTHFNKDDTDDINFHETEHFTFMNFSGALQVNEIISEITAEQKLSLAKKEQLRKIDILTRREMMKGTTTRHHLSAQLINNFCNLSTDYTSDYIFPYKTAKSSINR